MANMKSTLLQDLFCTRIVTCQSLYLSASTEACLGFFWKGFMPSLETKTPKIMKRILFLLWQNYNQILQLKVIFLHPDNLNHQVAFNAVCVLDTACTYSGFMGGLLLLAMIFISSKRLLYNWICVALSSCV